MGRMEDGPQTPEELEAHYGPEGPVVVAQRFFESLYRDRDLAAAYEVMTPELRGERTDEWVEGNAAHPALAALDHREVAESLADARSDHALWPAFEESSIQSFAETYSFVDLDSYGYASRPRPIGVDHELVLLLEADRNDPRIFERPTLISGAQFALEHRHDRWLVTGFSRVYAPSELLAQGRTRDDLVQEVMTSLRVDPATAEEIFDRSLAEEES
jgi:hypothetical protein